MPTELNIIFNPNDEDIDIQHILNCLRNSQKSIKLSVKGKMTSLNWEQLLDLKYTYRLTILDLSQCNFDFAILNKYIKTDILSNLKSINFSHSKLTPELLSNFTSTLEYNSFPALIDLLCLNCQIDDLAVQYLLKAIAESYFPALQTLYLQKNYINNIDPDLIIRIKERNNTDLIINLSRNPIENNEELLAKLSENLNQPTLYFINKLYDSLFTLNQKIKKNLDDKEAIIKSTLFKAASTIDSIQFIKFIISHPEQYPFEINSTQNGQTLFSYYKHNIMMQQFLTSFGSITTEIKVEDIELSGAII